MGSIINPFEKAYSKDQPFAEENRLNRWFGDTEHEYMDPLTTGYGYVIWTKLPKFLENNESALKFLTGIAKSFTMPSATLNVIEYNGLNNEKWGVPGTAEWDGSTFTIRMEEYTPAIVFNLISRWHYMIRDMRYGVSTIEDYTQSAYKGTLFYAVTDPTGIKVMFAAKFTGIFPTRVPYDALNLDVTTQDKVEPDWEFHFDKVFIGEEVITTATDLVESLFDTSVSKLNETYAIEGGSGTSG